MLKKIAIVSDSTACLTEELIKEHNIYINYLMIIFGNDAYQEFNEISPTKFLELCASCDDLPTTSQPSPGVTTQLYEKIFADGYDEIIHLTISSALSGSYASAINIAEMVNASNIHVFDTKTIAHPQAALAIAATKLAKEGKSTREIITVLEKLQQNIAFNTAINDITNLKKGGRISAFSASLGSLLSIKPIIALSPDGSLAATAKVRTFRKALKFLIAGTKNANLDQHKDEIGILHMENPEAATYLKSEILKIYPCIEILELPLSLVLAVHSGHGAAAVGWIKR